uniref:Uncharacterized protein n=1 Tax=Anoplophora glabripennis TaxID=217634 RepID=V5GHS5_ANOGL
MIPKTSVQFYNNLGILTVLNISHHDVLIEEGKCVARGIPSGQSVTEVPMQSTTPTEIELQRLNEILEEYKDCFAATNAELGNTNVEIKVRLTNSTPVIYRPYPLSFYEREIVRKIVKDLLENDIIELLVPNTRAQLDRPSQTLHLDHLGPFSESPNGNVYCEKYKFFIRHPMPKTPY